MWAGLIGPTYPGMHALWYLQGVLLSAGSTVLPLIVICCVEFLSYAQLCLLETLTDPFQSTDSISASIANHLLGRQGPPLTDLGYLLSYLHFYCSNKASRPRHLLEESLFGFRQVRVNDSGER